MRGADAAGFFGKLPRHGDFLKRRAPPDFLDTWDGWLQASIPVVREALGTSWHAAFLGASAWRFVLSASVCGASAYAGVWAPGVDSVGRLFPMTVMLPLDPAPSILDFAARQSKWFEQVESLLLAARRPGSSIEELDGHLQAASDWLLPGPTAEYTALARSLETQANAPQVGWLPLPSEGPAGLVSFLGERTLARQFAPATFWWNRGSPETAARWLSARGMPDPGVFRSMLDGSGKRADLDAGEPQLGDRASTGREGFSKLGAGQGLPTQAPSENGSIRASAWHCEGVAVVCRPDLGCFALASSDDADDACLAPLAQRLGSLQKRASLGELVEDCRRLLSEAERQRGASDAGSPCTLRLHFVALLVVEWECALISSGKVFLARVRDGRVTRFETDEELRDDISFAASTLGALVASGWPDAALENAHVQYEQAQPADRWFLCLGEASVAATAGMLGADASDLQPVQPHLRLTFGA